MSESRLIVGCGYLGMPLAGHWAAAGHRVFATTRGGPGRVAALQALGVEPVLFDVLQGGRLPHVDLVVTAVGMDHTQSSPMRDVYVDGLVRVARAFAEPPAKWLHVSSTSVYGQDDGAWVNEASPANPSDESGRTVLEAERALLDCVSHACVLRFGGIYGPNRLMKSRALRQGEPFQGDPERWLNLIHRDDGVAVLDRLAGLQPNQVIHPRVNVVDRLPVRRGDFYAEMARRMGMPGPVWQSRPQGSPAGRHEGNNRRVDSSLLAGWLGGNIFQFPTYREGLASCGPWD